MTYTEVNPDHVSIDGLNERDTVEQDSDEFQKLVDNIESVGTVIQPPLLRTNPEKDGDDLAVIVGQRRVLAAREAEGVEQIPVVLEEMDDEEALKATITENIDVFKQDVPMDERANALQDLWEAMGGEGVPTNSHLADELGVHRNTVRTWLEPYHEHWKDTSFDPRHTSDDFFDGREIGERSLAEIRRMTEDGNEGEAVAKQAEANGLTQTDVKTAKEIVNSTELNPYEAIEKLAEEEKETEADGEDGTEITPEDEPGIGIDEDIGDLDDKAASEPHIEAEVTFDSTTSIGLKEYADRSGQSPDEVIAEAVHDFLAEQGALPDAPESSTDRSTAGAASDAAPDTKDGAERLFSDD